MARQKKISPLFERVPPYVIESQMISPNYMYVTAILNGVSMLWLRVCVTIIEEEIMNLRGSGNTAGVVGERRKRENDINLALV